MAAGPICSGRTCSVVVAPVSWRRTITILENAVPKSMQAVQLSSTSASSRLQSSPDAVLVGAARGAPAGAGCEGSGCSAGFGRRNLPKILLRSVLMRILFVVSGRLDVRRSQHAAVSPAALKHRRRNETNPARRRDARVVLGVLDRVEGGLAAGAPFNLQLAFGGGCAHRLDDGADLAAQLRAQRSRLADRLAQRGCLLQSPGQRVVRLDPCGFGKRMVEIVARRTVGGELHRQHGRDESGGVLTAED